jgi:hypothetical protein
MNAIFSLPPKGINLSLNFITSDEENELVDFLSTVFSVERIDRYKIPNIFYGKIYNERNDFSSKNNYYQPFPSANAFQRILEKVQLAMPAPDQCNINFYKNNQTLQFHHDEGNPTIISNNNNEIFPNNLYFGNKVCTLTIGHEATMRFCSKIKSNGFKNLPGVDAKIYDLSLPTRSLLSLTEDSLWTWAHGFTKAGMGTGPDLFRQKKSMVSGEYHRISLNFRTVGGRWKPEWNDQNRIAAG